MRLIAQKGSKMLKRTITVVGDVQTLPILFVLNLARSACNRGVLETEQMEQFAVQLAVATESLALEEICILFAFEAFLSAPVTIGIVEDVDFLAKVTINSFHLKFRAVFVFISSNNCIGTLPSHSFRNCSRISSDASSFPLRRSLRLWKLGALWFFVLERHRLTTLQSWTMFSKQKGWFEV